MTAAAASSQVVLGAEASSQHYTVVQTQRLSLLGGALASIGAAQASGVLMFLPLLFFFLSLNHFTSRTDLTSDFRVGFLLRTPPKQQYLAQGLGTIFASLIAPSVYVLFASAYSCVNDTTSAAAAQCSFQAPMAAAWRAIAIAASNPQSSIPSSSLVFSAMMAVLGSASVLIRHHLWTGRWSWMRQYHPSMMALAMAFINPLSIYATAMLMGALLAWYWMNSDAKSFHLWGHAVAAGWIAGEGIGGVVNAGLQISGLSGDVYGTVVGCPGGAC